MTKGRKPLTQILNQFDGNEVPLEDPEEKQPKDVDKVESSDSLTAQLANPKKKVTKIRFTLDLDKSLDDRLNRSAKSLNRSKADIARIALERLLDELEREKYSG
jgi:hypothetical protein